MTQNSTLWQPYTQMKTNSTPLNVHATKGSQIHLANGQTLVDGVGSWWSCIHGYNHPHILEAIGKQIHVMPHIMSGGFVHDQAERLGQRLTQLLGHNLNHVFFSESGSVSVEIAIKMALQYWINQDQVRHKIIYFQNAYHGDTFLCMSISNEGWMHDTLRHCLPEQHLQPVPETAALMQSFKAFLERHAHTIAAVIIEPLVQAAGGMKVHRAQTLKALTQLCREYGILVIFDEVFTGLGRTGTLFAFEQAQVAPDIICLSKALTGGTLPLAATIATSAIFNAFLSDSPEAALMHGTTFMSNAAACAAANASLDLFEQEPRMTQVAHIERLLKQALQPLESYSAIKEVRVLGAMAAIQCAVFEPALLKRLKAAFIEDGVWIRPYYDIIYTTPAFTIRPEELEIITQSIIKNVKKHILEKCLTA